ncbi:UNVERIFIED_CONTAM: Serine protease SPPA, chloroplastic [Sesamum radiatum]|uniref:Serine protease SPPA, chloroplastic n=1 Tax=Sesamum radiatum TaxID=300843 RepID=A0AAW2V4U4_SESRA
MHVSFFQYAGKFIVGYVPACGEKEYYIGSACEELYAPPSAYFQLYGLTVQASFLGVCIYYRHSYLGSSETIQDVS